MILGIVGSEQAKFTPETESKAREIIRELIAKYKPQYVASGECHLGGIDTFAKEEAFKLGITFLAYPPATRNWEGYKRRNLQIAKASTYVICITIKEYPLSYDGMKFDYCYHCMTDEHIKSGGCWTVKQAKLMGKGGEVIVV